MMNGSDHFERAADVCAAGRKINFCTRQFEVSAAYISVSEGHASWWTPENCLS